MSSAMQREKRKAKRAKRRLVRLVVDEVSLVDRPAVPAATFLIAKRDEEDETVTDDATAKSEPDEATEDVEAVEVEEASADAVQKDDDEAVEEAVEQEAETAAAEQPEAGEVELEKAAGSWLKAIKVLRDAANDMDPQGLHLLATLIEYASFRYAADEQVKAQLFKACGGDPMEFARNRAAAAGEDVEKATRVLGPSGFQKIEAAATEIAERAASILDVAKGAKRITKDEEGELGEQPEESDEVSKQDEVEATAEPATPERSLLDEAGDLLLQKQRDAEANLTKRMMDSFAKIEERLESVLERQAGFSERLDKATGKV